MAMETGGTQLIKDTYFKVPNNGPLLGSGLALPAASGGPYHFVNCHFHPHLKAELQANYADSVYTRCTGSVPVEIVHVDPQQLFVDTTQFAQATIPPLFLRSVVEFGVIVPIRINNRHEVIDGVRRLKAALRLKLKTIPARYKSR